MLVFKVGVEAVDDGFVVKCPDLPALRLGIPSLWEACGVRPVLAAHADVPDDLVWLQVRARAGAVSVISDIHPLHWVAFHTLTCPAHPAFDRSDLLFDHALKALQHEAGHAETQGRPHTLVKFILSFLDGTKAQVPRVGGYALCDVVGGACSVGGLSPWLKATLMGDVVPGTQWHAPVIGLQVGIYGPEASTSRRFR